jgi:maltooligosyltrehalose trehalohydrolase
MSRTELPRAAAELRREGVTHAQVSTAPWRPSLGGWVEPGGARFRVWAPEARAVGLVVEHGPGAPRREPLARAEDGTFGGFIAGLRAGDRYRYEVDDRGPFPDPASRFQPEGVHGPSELVDPSGFAWPDDEWHGVRPEDVVFYELHVGTFSPEGTFDGVTRRLPLLKDLGVTAVELMPVHDFAGSRSWGYDGVALFAPTRQYGRPDDFRRLVAEAHRLEIAVFLDVVYNHFGPVGNYTGAFSPHYLSKTESSAWAACVNLTGEGSDRVREFLAENALHWVHEYHVDGLRLDATHALVDRGTRPFIAELVEKVQATVGSRRVYLVAEDLRNLAEMIRPVSEGGWGVDAVWADDLHHELRRFLSGDDEAYYRDYTGTTADIARTIDQGWFFTGQHSTHLGVDRGTDPAGLAPWKFVVCLQNHDQVGNRALGDRLQIKVELPTYRAATALLLTLPQTPLLFMGQEWAAGTRFLYFTDHDPDLGRLVTEGRRREFRHFRAFADEQAREQIPDPQDPATFERSRLDWSERDREPHASVQRLHRDLLHLRREEPALRSAPVGGHKAFAPDDATVLVRRLADEPGAPAVWVAALLRGAGTVDFRQSTDVGHGGRVWDVLLTTNDPPYVPGGDGDAGSTPPRVDLSGPAPVITFTGPAAVLLRERGG